MVEFDAAILPGVKQPLEVRRTRIAKLERGDVLVRIMASGLCHTDLEVIEGSLAYPMPIILGHEGAGVVEAGGRGRDRGGGGRPCRLLVEPALRPLLLLRARPADPVRAVYVQPAAICRRADGRAAG